MRYIVTVEVQRLSTQTIAVEASTELEAGLSAVALVERTNTGVVKSDVLQVLEDPKRERCLEPDRGKGYIAGII